MERIKCQAQPLLCLKQSLGIFINREVGRMFLDLKMMLLNKFVLAVELFETKKPIMFNHSGFPVTENLFGWGLLYF